MCVSFVWIIILLQWNKSLYTLNNKVMQDYVMLRGLDGRLTS